MLHATTSKNKRKAVDPPQREPDTQRPRREAAAAQYEPGAYAAQLTQSRSSFVPPGRLAVTLPTYSGTFLSDAATKAASTYARRGAAAAHGAEASDLAESRPKWQTAEDRAVLAAGGQDSLHLGDADINLGHKLADSTTKGLVYHMVHADWDPKHQKKRDAGLHQWAYSLTGDADRAKEIVGHLRDGQAATEPREKAYYAEAATHLAAGGSHNLRWSNAGMNQIIGHGYDANRDASGRMTPFSEEIAARTLDLHKIGVGVSATMAEAATTPTRFHGEDLSSSVVASGTQSAPALVKKIEAEADRLRAAPLVKPKAVRPGKPS